MTIHSKALFMIGKVLRRKLLNSDVRTRRRGERRLCWRALYEWACGRGLVCAWARGVCVGILKLPVIISVILRDGRNLESEIAAGATILDSSLRCAAFRMTGGGRCVRNGRMGAVQNDRGRGRCVRNDRMEVAAFGMAGKGCCVGDGRMGMVAFGVRGGM